MSQTIRKSFLSITLFFAMGLSATACGPQEGLDNGEQSESMESVEQAAVTYNAFRSGLPSSPYYCLDVQNGVAANNTPVQLYQCNSSPAQKWSYDATTLEMRSALDPNYCLEVAGSVAADGTPVQLYKCNGTVAQKWNRTSAYEFRTLLNTGYCLDVPGSMAANGNLLQVYRCNGTAAQKWR